jgi:hypothetical protein
MDAGALVREQLVSREAMLDELQLELASTREQLCDLNEEVQGYFERDTSAGRTANGPCPIPSGSGRLGPMNEGG